VKAFRGSRRFPPHLVRPRGVPSYDVGRRLAWISSRHGRPGGKLRYACDPYPVMARVEPPGRLRSSTGSPYERRDDCSRNLLTRVSLTGLLRGLFSARRGDTWGRAQALAFIASSHFSLAAPGPTYEPLYVHVADVAQRRVSGLFATPDPFRLSQSPLGAFHLPQAPTSVDRLRHRRGLSLAWAGWRFIAALAVSSAIPLVLAEPRL